MIEDSLKNRAHVVDYDPDIVPTKKEIDEILKTAYPLVTSKQKGYPYRFYVLGPNKERSSQLWSLCENNKIQTDLAALGDPGDRYKANNGLFHIASAPWTLIVTPRVSEPNAFHRAAFDDANSLWELADADFVNRRNRESCAIEIGMLAKTITGAALDRGWDTSYNICFPKDIGIWKLHFPFIRFVPALIQTLGKGKKYKWQTLTAEQSKLDTDAPFEEIFHYVDEVNYDSI